MDSPAELKKRLLFFMTSETGVGAACRVFTLKRGDEPLPVSLGMFPSRAVAGFASLLIRRDLGIKQAFPMGVAFLEGIIEVWMAPFAGLGFYIFSFLFLRLVLAEAWEPNEGNQSDYCHDQHSKKLTPLHN
jgi:hypothetical protein